MLNRLNLARAAGALSVVFTGWAVSGGAPQVWLLIALCSAVSLALSRFRRWRFPAAVWLGLSACQQLVSTVFRHHGLGGLVLPLFSALFAALASSALLAPSRTVADERAPLPPLPGTWALATSLVLACVDAVVVGLVRGHSDSVMAEVGLSSLLLFTALMLSSHAGPLRWPLQLASALVPVALAAMTGGRVADDAPDAVSQTLRLAALVAPGLAFALGLDWVRSGRSALPRALRGAGLVLVGSALPALIAAPAQLSARSLAILAAHALAFGLAGALAPRVARREKERDWRPAKPGAASRLAALIAVPLAMAVALAGVLTQPTLEVSVKAFALASIALVVLGLLALIRVRFTRALLWLAATLPVLLLGLGTVRRPEPLTELYAFGSLAVAAAVAWLTTSPKLNRYFVRWPRVAVPRAVPSFVLSAGVLAGGGLVMLLTATAANRGELLLRLPGPVSVNLPLLFDPPVAKASQLASRSGATVAADALGRGMWVVDEEQNRVALVGEAGVRTVEVGAWPEQLVVSATGRVFVTCRAAGRIDVIETDFRVSSIAVGPEPRGLALDETQLTLYVGLVTAQELVAVDVNSRAVRARVALPAAPHVLAMSRGEVAVLPRVGSALSLVSADLTDLREVELGHGRRRAWHGQALVPAGDDLFVVNASVDTGLDGLEVAVNDSGGYGGSVSQPVQLDVAQLHRGHLLVTPPAVPLLGTGEVTGALLFEGELAMVNRGARTLLALPLETVMTAVPARRPIDGDGATGLAVGLRGELVTFAAFDRRLVSLSPQFPLLSYRALEASTLDPELALGRRLFHRTDNTQTSGAGLACSTCHPDGREDGLVWNLKGASLQTPILAAKLERTAPYNWHGTAATLEESLKQTIGRLGGGGVSEHELHALARYLREGLRPPVKPEPRDRALVALGSEVFHRPSVGCAECHLNDGSLTDGARHDVGTLPEAQLRRMKGVGEARPAAFDTPSLLSVGLTAPYFHDGSAPTLEALVADNADRMGHTSTLSERERDALVAFLKTL